MSDNPAPETESSNPAPAESGQPATEEAPSTPETTPDPNTAQIERLKSQVNGMRGLAQPLIEAGVTSPEEVQAALAASKRMAELKQAGINLDSLVTRPEMPQNNQEKPDYLTADRFQELLDQREAASTHKAREAEVENSLKSFAKELGGENSDLVWDLTLTVAQKYMRENGQRYEYGHPLYESNYRPLSESDISAVKAQVQKRIDQIKGLSARQAVENQIPDGATPGTNGVMDGAASSANGNGLRDRDARRNRVSEVMRQNLAAAMGESISNA